MSHQSCLSLWFFPRSLRPVAPAHDMTTNSQEDGAVASPADQRSPWNVPAEHLAGNAVPFANAIYTGVMKGDRWT